eukprot:scaffold37059_cov57-Attheya_sp.AAC.3
MPTRVTLWVKRSSPLVLARYPIPKKQRTNDLRGIHIKSEIVNAGGEVPVITVKTEEIDDGSTACDHSASESGLYEPSSDPHLSHSASTSSTPSKQCTSQVGTSDNAEICAFESTLESDLDSLSNQDSEGPAMNSGFSSELQRQEELEYEKVAQNHFTTYMPVAAIPFCLNHEKGKQDTRWDERFEELVHFKRINGHTHVRQRSGPLGNWVVTQRGQYRLLKEGRESRLTNDKREKLESIGFELNCQPHWDQRLQDLLDFMKSNGYTNVPTNSG